MMGRIHFNNIFWTWELEVSSDRTQTNKAEMVILTLKCYDRIWNTAVTWLLEYIPSTFLRCMSLIINLRMIWPVLLNDSGQKLDEALDQRTNLFSHQYRRAATNKQQYRISFPLPHLIINNDSYGFAYHCQYGTLI